MSLAAHILDYVLGKIFEIAKESLRFKDEFLEYDVTALLRSYSDQHGRFSEQIPYAEEACFIKDNWADTLVCAGALGVKCLDPWFDLSHRDPEVAQYQQAAYERMIQTGKVTGEDTTVVRLLRYDAHTQTLELQRAKYSQQAKSNLVLDWDGSSIHRSFSFGTLRKKLSAQHGRQLPPLTDQLLANTVGIAAMILFKAESGEYLPYLQKRADGLAVFPGAYHCTASGATQTPLRHQWDGDRFSFADIFVDDMFRELYDEVGLSKNEIRDFVPGALCREYLRGGKPQVFFVGVTDLGPDELKQRRKAAIARKGKAGIKEIEARAITPRSADEFRDFLLKPKITLETLPALYYADKYAQIRFK